MNASKPGARTQLTETIVMCPLFFFVQCVIPVSGVSHTQTPWWVPRSLTPHITTRRMISNLPQLAYLPLGRWHGLDVEHGAQQVLDHLVLVLLASRLDLLDVGLGLLVRLLLGLLVSLGVLESFACTVSYACPLCIHLYRGTITLCLLWGCVRTSASNFLYSSSLDALYSSISFLASSRASLTRFVLYSRAVHQRSRSAQLAGPGALERVVVLGAFVHFWTILEASFSACGCCQPNLEASNLIIAVIPREGSEYPRSFGRTVMLLLLAMSPPRSHSGRRRTGAGEPCWRTFRVCRKQNKGTVSDMLKRESIVGPSWGEGSAKC